MSAAECGELLSYYRECDAVLRGYVRCRVGCGADTDDVVQDVYVRLARMPSLAGIRDSKAFVIHAARNLMRDRSRRARKRGPFHSEESEAGAAILAETPDLSGEPSLVFESLDTLRETARVLESLKDGARRAFMRYRIDAWSHAAIASDMGISVSMVEKHLRAAHVALRSAGIHAP